MLLIKIITPLSPFGFLFFAIAIAAYLATYALPNKLIFVTYSNNYISKEPFELSVTPGVTTPALARATCKPPNLFTVYSTPNFTSYSTVTSHFSPKNLSDYNSFSSILSLSSSRSAAATEAP